MAQSRFAADPLNGVLITSLKEALWRFGINDAFQGMPNQSTIMKTKFTTLLLSALLLGVGSAAPKQPNNSEPKVSSQSQDDKKGKKKADPKKAKEAAARKKSDNARKADSDAKKNKAAEEKMVKDSISKLKELAAKKKGAEAARNKAADALKSAEKNVAAIDGEMKRIAAQLKAKADSDRKKAEQARSRKLRETEATERAMIENMKKELQKLKQTVASLNQQKTEKKECCAECAAKTKKK